MGGVVLTAEASADESASCFHLNLDATAPFFDGHFPGRPILPAAAILTIVAAAYRARDADSKLLGFDAVRFSAPVEPDCPARLTFRELAGEPATRFELATGDEILVSGRIEHGAAPR